MSTPSAPGDFNSISASRLHADRHQALRSMDFLHHLGEIANAAVGIGMLHVTTENLFVLQIALGGVAGGQARCEPWSACMTAST